jgi:hypothetical protein
MVAATAACAQQVSAPIGSTGPSVAQSDNLAGKSSGGNTLTPANGSFRDASTDHVQSDGLGTYINGQNGVSSTINSGGNYLLNTAGSGNPKSPSRHLTIAPPAAYGPGCTLPFQSAVTVGADFANQELSHLTSMSVGSSSDVTLVINFTVAGATYYLSYDPSLYPDSSSITATRTSATTWTLEADSAAVAKIEKVSKSRVGCGEAQGMPFLITVTLQ